MGDVWGVLSFLNVFRRWLPSVMGRPGHLVPRPGHGMKKKKHSQFANIAQMAEFEYLTTLSSNTLPYSENQNKQRIEIYKNIRKTWSIFHETL